MNIEELGLIQDYITDESVHCYNRSWRIQTKFIFIGCTGLIILVIILAISMVLRHAGQERQNSLHIDEFITSTQSTTNIMSTTMITTTNELELLSK